MKKVWEYLKNFKNQRGAAAVEYGIMVALIAAVIVLTVTTLGQQVNTAFTKVVNALK
jgi:pilus assembly protein Flp/PilA